MAQDPHHPTFAKDAAAARATVVAEYLEILRDAVLFGVGRRIFDENRLGRLQELKLAIGTIDFGLGGF
jgi:hypothetical protein